MAPGITKLHNVNAWLTSCPKLVYRDSWAQKRIASPRIRTAAASSTGSEVAEGFEEGQLERPKWTGETPLSRLVAALISFKPLYSVLKYGARQVIISTAEKSNIPWRDMTQEILESDVYREKDFIEDHSVVYPDLSVRITEGRSLSNADYLNPFHAYDEGNLSWLAAAEAEAATMSIAKRAIPNASSIEEANQILRGNWLQEIENHHKKYSNSTISDILDIGCSVGVSTRYLSDKFTSAQVTGLDLSPYFVAVAQYKDKLRNQGKNSIRWIHGNGESTGLPSQSFDLVSISYVFSHGHNPPTRYCTMSRSLISPRQKPDQNREGSQFHECPERAIRNIIKEAFRLLRPGGTFALTDNSPKSKILQELPPVLFTLMKSTEPFLDEYYLTDIDAALKQVGFVNVHSVLTDPRHVTVTATVPY
ncbi:hypothetical protein F511_04720 [Dorcoceras hygrometricum]|uniref:Methyltransferase type 11 domain-containing protein n=1 Tax=Dorcoceras hygrometricum TaxID=472368 RepID=A0A2Z7B6S7_9LAMI|nr:hypothetical protein F511_04720 [Dorcoceras hygrometricum]